jgi:hypothetical protein
MADEYTAFVYHPELGAKLVRSRADYQRHINTGWADSPAAFGRETYPAPARNPPPADQETRAAEPSPVVIESEAADSATPEPAKPRRRRSRVINEAHG